MASLTQKRWDKAAGSYDVCTGGAERRWAPWKRSLFSAMEGRTLFVAAGTGLDFRCFPAGCQIVALDLSGEMLRRAKERAGDHGGPIELVQMDVERLAFPEESFDTVGTACTFCSVPHPVGGLIQLRRVLKPGGRILMFEHTGSRLFPFNLMMNVLNPVARRIGPEINRPTAENVARAGFIDVHVENIFLDMVKLVTARAPGSPGR